MAEKGDNQYTTPPFSAEDIKTKAIKLIRDSPSGPSRHDRVKLFAEWIRSDPATFPSITSFAKAKGINLQTFQCWGGALFWKRSRQALRTEALTQVIAKTPDLLEKKFSRDLQIVAKAQTLTEKLIANLQGLADSDDKKERAFLEPRLRVLAETIALLAETNLKLSNEGILKVESKSLNLHTTIIDAIHNRDQQFGVKE